jgi:glycosyltransferase involved in cell wall biosynthesis
MNRPLHVLLSAYACLPNAGTEPGNGWNWAAHLAARGLRVHVLTVTEGREAIQEHLRAHPQPLLQFSYVKMPAFLEHCTPLHYLWWQFAAVPLARRLHRALRFDVVHHVTYSSIHVPTQLWRLGPPTVFGPVGGGQTTPPALVGAFGEKQRSEQLRTAFTKFLPFSPLHRLWLRKMSVVLTTNTETFQLARALGKREVEPWFDAALPDSFFAEAPRIFSPTTEPLRLLWIGRMVPRKALPLALDVIAQVRRPVTLTIAGGGLPAEQVHRMITDRGLTGRVFWAERPLDRAEVRRAYIEHDALLFCSLRDSCPAQLVEAMGLGLPVITLDHHGARDLVPDGSGIKVPPTTPEGVARDMAAAVERYHDLSSEGRSAMSQQAWGFARTLNYADGAASFEMLYRRLLEGADVRPILQRSASHIRTAAIR